MRSPQLRSIARVEPRQALLREDVPRWLKFGGPIERTDREMCFGRQSCTLAGQGRATPRTKPAAGSSRRGIELGYLAFGDRVGRTFECDKNRSRCAGVSPATLAMAPIDSLWFTGRNETNRATQTATFELLGRAAHNLILPSS
jgi:hypothetical protein